MGLAMGATIMTIVLSPWGKQPGAHFNPAVTFTFYRLGKVTPQGDALFYRIAQLSGALAGVALASPPHTTLSLCGHSARHLRRRYHNRCRFHSALGYGSPEEFERGRNRGVLRWDRA